MSSLAGAAVYPGIDQLRLANAIGFDRTTISGVIDRMEAKALLVRRASTKDRCAKELHTTPKGRKLLADVEDATERIQIRILDPLTRPQQRDSLQSLETSRVPIDHALIAEHIVRVGSATDKPIPGRSLKGTLRKRVR